MGLSAVLEDMREDETSVVLDLGPAWGSNVEFWSRYPCKLHVGSFYFSWVADVSYREPETAWDEALLERLLPFPPGTVFDFIFCWDLFNYLDSEQLPVFVSYLTRFCKPGSRLLAILWLTAEVPAEPVAFKIVDAEHLEYARRSQGTRKSLGHQPRDIAKLMQQFQISGSFLLRHGVQEYVFSYSGDNFQAS